MRMILLTLIFCMAALHPAAGAAIRYTGADDPRLCGTMMPYPAVDPALSAYPDSLIPVCITHLGRHGARFLSSEKKVGKLEKMLLRADSLGTLTRRGADALAMIARIRDYTRGRWGALDSLGIAEQAAIAARMYDNYPGLFRGYVSGIATYVPRAVMSMYSFIHALTERQKDMESYAAEGRRFDPLLRFFTTDRAYVAYLDSGAWRTLEREYDRITLPTAPARRLLGDRYPASDGQLREATAALYGIVSSLPAAGQQPEASSYFSAAEMEACWRAANADHWLKRTASLPSSPAARAAIPLLRQMIEQTDSALTMLTPVRVTLRFAHAETIMPLLSLMRLPGCDYSGDSPAGVAGKWHDWHVAPLAANIQIVCFRAPSGEIYARVSLNETPVPALPGDRRLIIPWSRLRAHLLREISAL